MKQLVIVVSDLYFGAAAGPSAAGELSLPALARMTRFGTVQELPQGWRSWLAAWLGRHDLAAASPGSVAACACSTSAGGGAASVPQWAWLADPLHLTASLTSLHLSPRGLLRLDAGAQAELCRAFEEAFSESGYLLAPTRAGRFLAAGPAPPAAVETTDPARCLGSTLSDALPQGGGAGALRRLGAEIEMWLHDHPINALRARAGQLPVSTLWLWGGGAPFHTEAGAATADDPPAAAVLFSDDPYVEGLANLAGAVRRPAAPSLESAVSATPRCAVQLELFGQGGEAPWQNGSSGIPLRALEAFDRDWIAPALELLARGGLSQLVVVANDRQVSTISSDRLKRWRRPRHPLAVLQGARGSEPGRGALACLTFPKPRAAGRAEA